MHPSALLLLIGVVARASARSPGRRGVYKTLLLPRTVWHEYSRFSDRIHVELVLFHVDCFLSLDGHAIGHTAVLSSMRVTGAFIILT